MPDFLDDIRFAARTLRGTPGFAGLAIGVNAAIFSLISLLLIRDLPIQDTDTIAFIYSNNPVQFIQQSPVSAADYLDIRETTRTLENLAAVNRGAAFVLTGLDEPVRVPGFEATPNVFSMWGVPPMLGRGFAPGDDAPGAERVAVLSHGGWVRRFGADPGVVGRTIRLDGFETTIVGVLDSKIEFGSLATAELWVPLRLSREAGSRSVRNLWISGRLAPGATLDQAREEIDAIGRSLAE